jgi:hypothetical protein
VGDAIARGISSSKPGAGSGFLITIIFNLPQIVASGKIQAAI